MEKIENPLVKEYLINFVSGTLDNCELFTNTFEKGFARKRLEIHLEKVFTNEFSKKLAGYHSGDDSSITICTEIKDEPLLTPEELEKDKSKLSTLLHEAIHAILERTKQECKKFGINYGTGILEQTKCNIEFGRGLNEGLTNWICEKAGVPNKSYKELTNFVKQLELAIGEGNVMKLAKGNIKKNVAKRLNMTISECYTFLGRIDEVYRLQDIIFDNSNMLEKLKRYMNRTNLSDEEAKEAIEDFEELQNTPEYISLQKDPRYINFLHVKGEKADKEDTIENKIKYLTEALEEDQKQLDDVIKRVESKIFDKYFKKEYDSIAINKGFSSTLFEKLKKLKDLMYTRQTTTPNMEYSSDKFQENYYELENKYVMGLSSLAEDDFKKNQLTVERFKQLFKYASKIDYGLEFCADVGEIMSGEHQSGAQQILYYLSITNQLQDISRYSIYYADIENGSIPMIAKDNKVIASNFCKPKKLRAKDETSENYQDIFDFILEENEDSQNIIREFSQIKQRIQKQAPNATISIFDRVVTIDFGSSQSIYVIDNGKMLPVSLRNQEPIKVTFQQGRSKYLPTTAKKDSPISKLMTNIKRKLFKNKKGTVSYESKKRRDNTSKKFRESMITEVDESSNTLGTQTYEEIYLDDIQNREENR